MPKLLVIDDEATILYAFRKFFQEPEVTLRTARTSAEGLELVASYRPDVVVLDVNLPDKTGLETFQFIRKLDSKIPVIFITGHGTTATAIEAIKLGAFDYLFKPLEFDELNDLIHRALKISRLMRVPIVVSEEEPGMHNPGVADALLGRCSAMQEVYKAIGRVAPQDVNVLITGESGTGKELVARAVYQHSRRAAGSFLAINCAAIPETLLESELFGHEKGAFTGADRQRIGKFEQCRGGTLFLDEIGDMTPLTQSKILRVLQEQQFERVGGNETIQSDVRLIAATNRELEAMVSAGQFRSDLYYRLSVFTIHLPPLRERGDDLTLLVEHFIRLYNAELGKNIQSVAPELYPLLRQYPWPGNVRELQSVIKQALLHSAGPVLVADFLPAHLRTLSREHDRGKLDFGDWDRFISDRIDAGSDALYAEANALTDAHLLKRALQHTGGNQVQAARILGISRVTLRAKMRSLGITTEQVGCKEPNQ